MKKQIRLKVQNGISYHTAIYDILNVVADKFDFVESEKPDYILFGPYGNDIPAPGPYVRIGYFCENITPDLDICEWAFGIPTTKFINNEKYRRIQWHNINPGDLIKRDWDVEKIFASKTKFCNFLYSHPVPYREAFFRQLSKYKKVDAPGKSMNNMASFDKADKSGWWEAKYNFLSGYKFTIAFENYIYPGYQTEKLYDAMLCQSLPVYCGDPNIGDVFNTKSFLNAAEFIDLNRSWLVKYLENKSQLNFVDVRPRYYQSVKDKVQRKLKSIGKDLKMNLQFKKLDFSDLIDQVIMLDKDPDKYMSYLSQPWLNNNSVSPDNSLRNRWIEIFSADK